MSVSILLLSFKACVFTFIQNMKQETVAACNALKDKLTEAAALAEGSFADLSNRYAAPAEAKPEATDEE